MPPAAFLSSISALVLDRSAPCCHRKVHSCPQNPCQLFFGSVVSKRFTLRNLEDRQSWSSSSPVFVFCAGGKGFGAKKASKQRGSPARAPTDSDDVNEVVVRKSSAMLDTLRRFPEQLHKDSVRKQCQDMATVVRAVATRFDQKLSLEVAVKLHLQWAEWAALLYGGREQSLALTSLAILEYNAGDLVSAAESQAKALNALMKGCPEEELAIAEAHFNLAAIEDKMTHDVIKLADMDPLAHYDAALDIRQRLLGPTHHHTIAVLINKGAYHARRGEDSKAMLTWQDALARELDRDDAADLTPSEQREGVALLRMNIGAVMARMNAFTEDSVLVYQSALDTWRRVATAPEHPHHAQYRLCLQQIAVLLEQQGKFAEAITYADEELSATRAAFASDAHPEVLRALYGVASICAQLQDKQRAGEAYHAMLAAVQGDGEEERRLKAEVMTRLASLG